MRRFLRTHQVLAPCLLALAGCASVQIDSREGTAHVSGLLLDTHKVTLPQNGNIVIRRRGVGIFVSDRGLTIGGVNEVAVYADVNKCNVIIFPDSAQLVEEMNAKLQQQGLDLSKICLIKGN